MLCWIRDLETAKNVSDVVCLARACVAAMPEVTRCALPCACHERGIASASDVLWWSERLSEEYWRRRGLGLDFEPLQDAWGFFLRAAIQTGRLATRTPATA